MVFFLFIKEICVLAVSVVPEDSKEATCLVRGVPGDLGICGFAMWNSIRLHFGRPTACTWSADCNLFPRLLAPGFCTPLEDSTDSSVLLVLALLVTKPCVGGGFAGLGQGMPW